jgi:HAD superfamily hydrolase (TIGR01509 family)
MKLVVFDMGHVFINFSWDAVCEGFASRAGIPRDRFDEILGYLGSLGYEKGKISTGAFLAQLNNSLKLELDLSEFTQLWNATFEEDKDMRSLMDQLAQRWPLYLLSNTNENHYSYLQQRFNVARNFREVILSYQVGYSKPEAEIYAEVYKRSGFNPADCLFIDDLEPNIEAAQRLGMKTILYRGIEDLQIRLPNFGVTV